jgi:integrase
MLAKSVVYKGSVYIYASRNREHIRIPVGIKTDKLGANGLLNKSSGVDEIDNKNKLIRDKLKQVQIALDDYPKLSSKELIAYIKKGILPNAPLEKQQLSFIDCFQKFVDDSKNGIRLTDKGTVYALNTVKSYQSVLTNLKKFKDTYDLEWSKINDTFYNRLCEYYWFTKDSYDNNTGKTIKIVTTMLNWCYSSGLIANPISTKKWKSWKEDIEILVLYADEIKILHKMPIEEERLERTRDIFLMGVFTCLRVEDLLNLTEKDVVVLNNEYYVNTHVKKVNKHIRIKLNPIGVDIIKKYRNKYHTLLPTITSQKFNENLKDLAKAFKKHLDKLKESQVLPDIVGNDWDKDFKRIRTKKGVPHYEFVKPTDYISSHCMRRSGVTNLLMLGLSPFEVSQISGHAVNSKDFAKYVKIATQVVDKKSVDAWSNVLA